MVCQTVEDRLVISNDYADLRHMTQWLHACGQTAGMDSNLIFSLDVCANEAVGNIISYAYADRNRHDISLELSSIVGGARLVIRDDGRAFNPLEVPQHENPASIAEAPIGGLGVHLIRSFASHCEYRRESGCNVLVLEAASIRRTNNV